MRCHKTARKKDETGERKEKKRFEETARWREEGQGSGMRERKEGEEALREKQGGMRKPQGSERRG